MNEPTAHPHHYSPLHLRLILAHGNNFILVLIDAFSRWVDDYGVGISILHATINFQYAGSAVQYAGSAVQYAGSAVQYVGSKRE